MQDTNEQLGVNQTVSTQPQTPMSESSGVVGQSPPLSVSPVVVPSSQKGVPGWFFMLFVLVVVLFMVVTGLLVWTLQTKKSSEQSKKQSFPQGTSTQVQSQIPTVTVVPTTVPAPIDNVMESLRNVDTSDEIGVISQDIDSTDISFLKEETNELDRIFGVSTP